MIPSVTHTIVHTTTLLVTSLHSGYTYYPPKLVQNSIFTAPIPIKNLLTFQLLTVYFLSVLVISECVSNLFFKNQTKLRQVATSPRHRGERCLMSCHQSVVYASALFQQLKKMAGAGNTVKYL